MSDKTAAPAALAEFTLPAGTLLHVDNGVPIRLTQPMAFTGTGVSEADDRIARFVAGHAGNVPKARASAESVSKTELDAVNSKLDALLAATAKAPAETGEKSKK